MNKIICSDCEQLKKKEARGLCKLCYNKEQRKLYPENGEYMVWKVIQDALRKGLVFCNDMSRQKDLKEWD